MPITLTNDNYYSIAANRDYMSVSQFKDFCGTRAHSSCEATAYKKLTGEIIPAKTTSLLVGAYVDAYYEGTLDKFKADNPEIFKKTGDKGLKSEYIGAEEIIARTTADPLFAQYMSGQKQVIMTGNLLGIDWKIKMDSYHPDDKIVDLKIMKDMEDVYSPETRSRHIFTRYWGYDIQGAIYQKIVELNTGKRLPFYLAVATKETPCDFDIFEIPQSELDDAFEFVRQHIEHAVDIKNGTIQPRSCGKCPYCRQVKKLVAPRLITDLLKPGINTPVTEDDYDNFTDDI